MNALSTNTYYEALVCNVVQETPTVTTVCFTIDGASCAFIAGQYVSVYFKDLNNGVGKAYSLSSIPSDPAMSITVKSIGAFSRRICSLQPGDTLTVSSPFGFFNVEDTVPIVAIAAGVGIAPIWSIVQDTLHNQSSIPIALYCTAPTASELVFNDAIDAAVAAHPTVQVRYFTTREVSPVAQARRLSVALDEIVRAEPCRYYVCGSESFVRSMWVQLMQAGVDETAVVTETFFEASV